MDVFKLSIWIAQVSAICNFWLWIPIRKVSPSAYELTDVVSVNCIRLSLVSVATWMDFFFSHILFPSYRKESLCCVNTCTCRGWARRGGEMCGMHMS